MKRKISLILFMAIFAFSIAGCGSDKSGDNAKADNTTSTTQETQSITKKEQSTIEVKNEESSKSEKNSGEAMAGEEVAIAEDNNDVNNAVTGDDIKEPEKSEEVISEVVAEEPAKEEQTTVTEATDSAKDKGKAVVSGDIKNDSDMALAQKLVESFGTKKFSKGEKINLNDYCDADSFSGEMKSYIITGMSYYVELNENPDYNDLVFTFNIYNEGYVTITVDKNPRRGTYLLDIWVSE